MCPSHFKHLQVYYHNSSDNTGWMQIIFLASMSAVNGDEYLTFCSDLDPWLILIQSHRKSVRSNYSVFPIHLFHMAMLRPPLANLALSSSIWYQCPLTYFLFSVRLEHSPSLTLHRVILCSRLPTLVLLPAFRINDLWIQHHIHRWIFLVTDGALQCVWIWGMRRGYKGEQKRVGWEMGRQERWQHFC